MQLHAQKQICVTPTHTHLQQQHWTEQIRYLDLCAPARRQASAFVSAVPRFLAVSLICRITSGLCSSKVQDAVHLGHVHLGGQAPTLQPRSNLIDRDGLERSTAWWHCIRQSANPWTVTVCSNLHSRSKPCTEVTSRQVCVICPLSSCTYHTGAANVASTTPQRDVVGAVLHMCFESFQKAVSST